VGRGGQLVGTLEEELSFGVFESSTYFVGKGELDEVTPVEVDPFNHEFVVSFVEDPCEED
jgi:hypothetical protein